ncbi:CU044_5270 family protein [Nocardioides alcanivorans]|uniref:CU044_5270 family protein n=1 Tax=Nocardioides alcanivorans TaxID=2897352 RepID=UPI001F215E50|nr:CU044_5270 family protein [Nocardioides alcanivorans]
MDANEKLADELREALLRDGAEPRDLTPLPGQQERMEGALAAILATPRGGAPTPPAPTWSARRKRRLTVLSLSGLTAAAAAVTAVVVALQFAGPTPPARADTPPMLTFELVPDGQLPGAGEPAAPALERLASVRAAQRIAQTGDVQHVAIDAWWTTSIDDGDPAGTTSRLEPVHTDSYFHPDAMMRIVERRGSPLKSDGRIADERSDLADRPATHDDSFPSPEPGPTFAATLPTTAAGVRAALAGDDDPEMCRGHEAGCLVADMVDLHRSYVVPTDVGAALWSALADEPAVIYLGTTTDRVGRDAVAFTVPSYDDVSQLIVFADPETGAFLGDETVLVAPSEAYSFEPPAVTSFTAIVEASFVEPDDLPRTKR